MPEQPKVWFLNNAQSSVDWFMRGPSLEKIAELGWTIHRNESGEKLEPEQWAELIADADALLTTWGSPKVDEVVLAQAERVRIIGHVGGSVAPYMAPCVFERGIRVSTANDLMARSVAEACMMLLLMGLRRAHLHVKLGTRSEPMVWGKDEAIRPVEDCVIGIWGFGDIARWVVRMLGPFEPKQVLVVSGHLSDAEAAELGMTKVEFDELFARSDVVFTLAGMTVANTGRVGPAQLAALPDGAMIINVGRAPLIQPEALVAELQRGRITACLDVYEKEPLPEDDPLNQLPNVILQPHNGGTARDAKYMAVMLDELDRFFRGEPLQYEVSLERGLQMTDMGAVRQAQQDAKQVDKKENWLDVQKSNGSGDKR